MNQISRVIPKGWVVLLFPTRDGFIKAQLGLTNVLEAVAVLENLGSHSGSQNVIFYYIFITGMIVVQSTYFKSNKKVVSRTTRTVHVRIIF